MMHRMDRGLIRAAASLAAVLVLAGGVGAAQPSQAEATLRPSGRQPLRVVATLSVFGDLVKQVGGDEVDVSTIASPRFNPHFLEPKPSHVLKVKRADLLVHAGLDLEAWRGPLIDAAGNARVMPGGAGELDLSVGIPLLEVPDRPLSRLMGDIHLYGNPHYWLDPENARMMARAIAAKLSELDPAHRAGYEQRLAAFLDRLDQKTVEWRHASAAMRGQEVVAYHNEWPYLAAFLGLKIERFLEPKPGIPPGPQHLGTLEAYMKARGIRVIIQPTYFSRASSEALAKRVGAAVVTVCQNVGELPGVQDYFSWMDYNVHQLTEALAGSS